MTEVSPPIFSPEMVTLMRSALDPNFGRIAIGADATGAFLAWVTAKR